MPRPRALFLIALLASFLSPLALPARAQHGGGGHGGGGMGGGMGPGFSGGGGMGPGRNYDNSGRAPDRAPESAGTVRGMRSGQLGPLGRWWDDKHFAKGLKLRPVQQEKMDSIFATNRPVLLKGLQDYQQEQGRLQAMYQSKTLDENTLYAQIDKVSQARAELGKAYTHYMLQIRGEMDPDQLNLLDAQTRKP